MPFPADELGALLEQAYGSARGRNRRAAADLRVTESTISRWARGEVPIPGWALANLRRAAGRPRGGPANRPNSVPRYQEALGWLLTGQPAALLRTAIPAGDFELVRSVFALALQDPPGDLALTDPRLYELWRAAVTKWHLAGWGAATPDRLASLVRNGILTGAAGRVQLAKNTVSLGSMHLLDHRELRQFLGKIGEALRLRTTLCLIGSAAGLLSGQPKRMTIDIDVWSEASTYDSRDLGEACEKAGLLFDPTSPEEPDRPYLQIVRRGIVQLPKSFEATAVDRFDQLAVTSPPPALLVALKLARGEDRDIEDAVWWTAARELRLEDVACAVESLPSSRQRTTARENLVIVQLTQSAEPSSSPEP